MTDWKEMLDRLYRAAAALEIPRGEVDALMEQHGAEVRAWTEGAEVSGPGLPAFSTFCLERGVSLDWVHFGDEASLLRYTRTALTK